MLELLKDKILLKTIEEPPYEYNFLLNLPVEQYPLYLKKMFKGMTGDELNLKHPKTFNEKIQWLKLNDATPLKTQLTDKVKVREWVKEKIGGTYLKPALQICNNFDEIDFDKLPETFIIKTNHGCKWHFNVKSKTKLLSNEKLFKYMKMKFEGWLTQNFFPWAGFEMQYKDIEPKIIIEPVLIGENERYPSEIEVYCFNSKPKIFQKIKYTTPALCSVYNEDFTESDIKFNAGYIKEQCRADNLIKEAVELSKKLAEGFKLVRVDWLIYQEKIYFNEMTFTPYSGFFLFEDKSMNLRLGKMLDLE